MNIHKCERVNIMVPPLSSSKIFAQACLKESDLLCSIYKLTSQGVNAVPDKQYASDTVLNVKFMAMVSLNIFNPITQRWYYLSWYGAN